MVLKELEIQGFKSFPDKLKVTVDKGITAVVGPNGSGKSNISDAIRWVLGETSAKQLRGAGKMENVIFGGTQLRGAMGFASVRLYLDNEDRTLDINADEVVIGRKYYRSGDSEYSINGQVCRLKDIYELFLDTGLGRDGYSIIGQGRIAEIVGAKSAERREIFEEASGIAKYRYRKNEAQRRLASAEENLERLRDILDELESRVGPLERESKKAQQFLELAEERKSLEITLWVEHVRSAKETVRDVQRKFETAEAEYSRFDKEQKDAEELADEIHTETQRLTMDIDRHHAEIRSITEEMSGRESRIAVLKNDIEHTQQNIENMRASIAQTAESEAQIETQVAQHEESIKEISAQLYALEINIKELTDLLETIQRENSTSGEKKGEVTSVLAKLTEEQSNLRVEIAGLISLGESAGEQLVDLENRASEQEIVAVQTQQECEENRPYLDNLLDKLNRLANMKSGVKLKLEARQKALEEADSTEQKVARNLDSATQRLSVLRDLEKNMEGYGNAVKSVMRAASVGRLRGIVGPVSSIITVEKGYETAVETALGAALQNIVVDGETFAKNAMAFLREERAGRATFLPLDTIQASSFNGALTGTAQLASDLVQCDAKYQKIVTYLLGRIVVVDDINEASGVAKRLNYRNRIVTVDGQVINAGGSFTGGSVQRSAGLFTRKQEIEDLKVQLAHLQKQREQAEENTDKYKAQVDALSAELLGIGSEEITANNDKIRAEMEQKRLETSLEQAQGLLGAFKEQISNLKNTIKNSEEQIAEKTLQNEQVTTKLETLAEQLKALTEGDDNFLETHRKLSDELSEKRLEHLALQKDKQLHISSIETLSMRNEETAKTTKAVLENIAKLEQLIAESHAQIEEVENAKGDYAGSIANKEEQIRLATNSRLEKGAQLTALNAKAKTAAENREQMGGEMARLFERKQTAEQEYDQTIAKLWEEYQLSLTQGEALCIEFENVTALRAQVASVRAKIRALGNVNVGAIEEFKEVKERYDTLFAQVSDVEKSKAELHKMIAELAEQMKEIFSENFEVINQNFSRIFKELFGGGSASLSLEEDADILESGIEIKVAPPGKVIKNLSALSGGEQSLVAISIYFAILAVNPAPFCILDEIEAALDDSNVVRYAQYLKRISDKSQFIVITHRRGTMEAADVLYGVTMQDDGVSKLLRLDVNNVDASLVK